MDHPDFANAGSPSTDSAFGGQLDKALSKRFELGEEAAGSPDRRERPRHPRRGPRPRRRQQRRFNGHGVVGTGYACRGMILRVFDDQGVGTDADAAAAMYYAADHGADVINISLGTENFSQLFQDAATYAIQKGSLVGRGGQRGRRRGRRPRADLPRRVQRRPRRHRQRGRRLPRHRHLLGLRPLHRHRGPGRRLLPDSGRARHPVRLLDRRPGIQLAEPEPQPLPALHPRVRLPRRHLDGDPPASPARRASSTARTPSTRRAAGRTSGPTAPWSSPPRPAPRH